MSLEQLAALGGIWLSLLYSAAVMPASVWVIQVTVSRGWTAGAASGLGVSLAQLPWVLVASILLFQAPGFWRMVDVPLRLVAVLFLAWMTYRCMKAPPVQGLRVRTEASRVQLFSIGLWRSFTMPWRLPLWAAFIISVGVHLRGVGLEAALLFSLGAVAGQLLWHGHFIVVAGLFGNRVPEDICLRSLNKLAFLSVTVHAGLAFIILAGLSFYLF